MPRGVLIVHVYQGAWLHMQIPLVDLKAQYQTIKHEVLAAVSDVLENMQLFLGPAYSTLSMNLQPIADASMVLGSLREPMRSHWLCVHAILARVMKSSPSLIPLLRLLRRLR